MNHSSIILTDNSASTRLTHRQIRQVGELIQRLDTAGISYALGLKDNEPLFVLPGMGLCTLAQTARRLGAV